MLLRSLIERPVAVTMMVFVTIVLGLVSVGLLPVSLIPDVDIPYITVKVSAPGMSAREIDASASKPLIQALMGTDNLENLTCESSDGGAVIKLSFEQGSDIGLAFIEVNEKVDQTMPALGGIPRPKVIKASATDIPAFYVNISPKDSSSFAMASDFAENFAAMRLEQLPEVAMVDVSGTVEEEISVVPDLGKLAEAGISLSDFQHAITSADLELSNLTIRDNHYRYSVRFSSVLQGPEDIAGIWIKSGERLLTIGDLASVSVRQSDREGLVRSDGREAVTMAVIKQSDAKMSSLRKSASALVESMREANPTLTFTVTRDQTELLRYSISNLGWSILLAVLLAGAVIFVFMREARTSALVVLTIPLSLIFSMLWFYAIGLSINIISLSGLLLGVGMMTDNSIVLVDNIAARWRRGEDLKDAVLLGTSEVTGPMLSSVLTTCAVFLPLIFLSGIAGAMFYDQAMSVTIVLLTSYLVTITVIPVYYYNWYKNTAADYKAIPSYEMKVDKWDGGVMGWFLNHDRIAWLAIAVSAVGMVLCFVLMPKSKLPEMTRHESVATIDWNEPVSVEENERRTAEIENAVSGEAVQITSLVGMQQFVLSHSGSLRPSESSVYFDCGTQEKTDSAIAAVRKLIAVKYPSADLTFSNAMNIFDMVFGETQAQVEARLRPLSSSGIELGAVREAVKELRKDVPWTGFADPRVRSEITLSVRPDMMALYGVGFDDLATVLSSCLDQNKIMTVSAGGKMLPVILGTGEGAPLDEAAVEKDGAKIPLSQFMDEGYSEDLRTFYSAPEGAFYPLSIDVPAKDAERTVSAVGSAVRKNGDFDVSFVGAWFSNKKMALRLSLILLVAVILLYLILASQFESLGQPLIILSEIVIDVFVSLFVLWVLGVTINLMSMIGLVVITGIVINDSILKIDTINRLRRSGTGLREAVMTASSRRFKAIVMTSLTTILAVVPFLWRGSMGADLQYPMTLTIVAGMIIGTLVSLFVVPALYYSVYGGRKAE